MIVAETRDGSPEWRVWSSHPWSGTRFEETDDGQYRVTVKGEVVFGPTENDMMALRDYNRRVSLSIPELDD